MLKIVSLLMMVLVVISCESVKEDQKEPGGDLNSTMFEMGRDLGRVFPLLFGEGRESSKNSEVTSLLDKLHRHSKQITMVKSGDPALTYHLKELSEDFLLSKHAYSNGRFKYARQMVLSALSHCMDCHSVKSPQFQRNWQNNLFVVSGLDPVNQAKLLVASRQVPKAVEQLKTFLKGTDVLQRGPFYLEDAIKKYIALSVGVKEPIPKISASLNTLLQKTELPYFLSGQIKSWKMGLKLNGNQISRKSNINKVLNRLTKELSGYVENRQIVWVKSLYYADFLHKQIEITKNENQKARMYMLLGKIYSDFGSYSSLRLPEYYYESCIHTKASRKLVIKCYSKYEESVLLGFTGSGGTFLPQSERDKLKELKTKVGL